MSAGSESRQLLAFSLSLYLSCVIVVISIVPHPHYLQSVRGSGGVFSFFHLPSLSLPLYFAFGCASSLCLSLSLPLSIIIIQNDGTDSNSFLRPMQSITTYILLLLPTYYIPHIPSPFPHYLCIVVVPYHYSPSFFPFLPFILFPLSPDRQAAW